MAEQMIQHKEGEKVTTQAIPAGYKQTEVGVIPEDWRVIQLGDLSEFVTSGSRGWAKYYSISGALFIRSQNVRDGKLCLADSQHVNIPLGTEGGRTKVKLNDILVTITGNSVGNVALVSQEFEEAYISQHVGLVRLKDSSIGSYVCRYLSPSAPGNLQIKESQSGQSKPGLNLQNLRDFLIAVPQSRDEAREITSALDDTDALVEGLEQLIAKKQAIKTATMQQLLTGRTRLPQFALRADGTPKGYKTSELGQIPEDWEVVCFDQLKDKKDNWAITGGPFGSNLKASDYTENGVRVIQLQNIGDGVFKNDDFVYTSYKKANELISCNIYPDEIILSKMGDPVARACLIPHFHSRYVMCSDGIRLKVDSQSYSEKFVFYFLNYQLFRNQALDASTGSTRKRIGLSELRDLLLFAPTKEEQTAIATILSDMDSELTALEQKLAKARDLKQGMMQQLLTGRIRLPVEQVE